MTARRSPGPPRRSPGSTPPECSFDGCHDAARWLGRCGKHHQRWKKHGDPALTPGNGGPEHYRWSGDDASYSALHKRVTRERGRADRCIIYGCNTGSTTFEWANISHRYLDTG